MNKDTMNEVLAHLNQLPALPMVVQEVIRSFDDPKITTSKLAHKISQDQIITAKVLRIANSSFYGLSRQVGSVQDAVVILGFDSVRTLTIAAGLIHGFSLGTDTILDRKKFWHTSIQVAVYAKAIAKRLGQNQEIAFTAGLLHDIGQIVLALCIPDVYGHLLIQQSELHGDLFEIEQAELGFDHALLGSEVAKRWKFPLAIQHAIEFHHMPDQTIPSPITDIVYLANLVNELIEDGSSDEEILLLVPIGVQIRLDWTPEKIKAMLSELRQLAACTGSILES